MATIGTGLVSIGAVSETSGELVVASQRRVGGVAASSSIKSVKLVNIFKLDQFHQSLKIYMPKYT